ncbi:hypothetical protein [Pseudaestuariivita atlantica]|uniref:Uncharacterized protein n=1 Tax=Pseudaestuariivita atlantica TaxID=1317121 RepID=A0A0L1JTV0_9RHOB|nr:hypothetical protein [Pseudaestuariivita atlantica]KNG95186.1 hypothetical protein ATO11_00625 [Pseudaestuariivita atlantica]
MTTYDITISSPMGEFPATITLGEGEGHMSGKGGSGPLEELHRAEDGSIRFNVRIDRPMPMTMKFSGVETDAGMDGTVKFGLFAKGTFAGTRAT